MTPKNRKTSNRLHAGHRQRLKNRFLTEGLDNFDAHNILELLLFFGIPQKDTNELAHVLINTFGSLSGVLNADIHDLEKIPGMGEHTAILLKLVQALAGVYTMDCYQDNIRHPQTVEDCHSYLCGRFLGMTEEQVYGIFYDSSGRITGNQVLARGSAQCCDITPGAVFDAALQHHAKTVLLSHNHPDGNPQPSFQDLSFTANLQCSLEMLGLQLMDHVIVANGRVHSILTDDPYPEDTKQ